MTFDDARCQHLRELDEVYLELRGVVADPSFTDRRGGVFATIFQRFKDTLEKVRRVNQSQQDLCQPDPEPDPGGPHLG